MHTAAQSSKSHGLLSHITAVLKLAAFLLSTFILLIPHALMLLIFGSMVVAHFYHRLCCRIFGIYVLLYNQESVSAGFQYIENKKDFVVELNARQTIYLSNHVSYLDISVLGGYFHAAFVAKSDVAGWPLFGLLAKLQQTVFIPRQASGFKKAKQMIAQRLQGGESLIFFPEGTSSEGVDVLPLKSSLFEVFRKSASKYHVALRPVSVVLSSVDDTPLKGIVSPVRDYYAWYGDMTLVPHLWHLAHARRIDIAVYVHAALDADSFMCRKDMAQAVLSLIQAPIADNREAAHNS